MKRILLGIAGLSLTALAAPTFAQTSDFETAMLGQSVDARVGIIIPFGGDRKSKNTKPQLALMSRRTNTNRASIDWAIKPNFGEEAHIETRLALTLSAEPQLRLNGQGIYDFGGAQSDLGDGAKKAGKVALVAGAVMLTIVVVALARVAACGGDGEEDKC